MMKCNLMKDATKGSLIYIIARTHQHFGIIQHNTENIAAHADKTETTTEFTSCRALISCICANTNDNVLESFDDLCPSHVVMYCRG